MILWKLFLCQFIGWYFICVGYGGWKENEMTRYEFIEKLNEILGDFKENSVGDISERAFEKTVYCIEGAIDYLVENEE